MTYIEFALPLLSEGSHSVRRNSWCHVQWTWSQSHPIIKPIYGNLQLDVLPCRWHSISGKAGPLALNLCPRPDSKSVIVLTSLRCNIAGSEAELTPTKRTTKQMLVAFEVTSKSATADCAFTGTCAHLGDRRAFMAWHVLSLKICSLGCALTDKST